MHILILLFKFQKKLLDLPDIAKWQLLMQGHKHIPFLYV